SRDDGREDEVAAAVVGQLFLQSGIDGKCGVEYAQRVAVRRSPGDQLGADDTAGAAAIVHDDLLSQELGETWRDHPGEKVGTATRHERHEHADRSDGIVRARSRYRSKSARNRK